MKFLLNFEGPTTLQADTDMPLFKAVRAITLSTVRIGCGTTITADAANYLVFDLYNDTQAHVMYEWSTETGQEGELVGVMSGTGFLTDQMTQVNTAIAVGDEIRFRVRETGDGKFWSNPLVQIEGDYV